MSAVSRKIEIALALLNGLVAAGMEYPDAHTYAVEKSGLTDAQADQLRDAYDAGPEPYICSCCGEECEDRKDCCSDELPEPGDVRETGR